MLTAIFDQLAAATMQTRTLAPRESLFRQGEPARYVFAVESGHVTLARYLSNGKMVVMHTARAGETFAEAALFSEVYHCHAIADVTTHVRQYQKQDVLAGLQRDPALMLEYTALLSRQVQKLRTQLELRSIPSARERILQCLLLEAAPDTLRVELHTPLKELAARLGLAHETLYRELAQMEEDKVIARTDKTIKILKADGV